jgi:hypothetical protein
MTKDERQQSEQHGRRQQSHAAQIEAPWSAAAIAGQELQTRGHHGGADRDVDKENGTPAGIEQVRGDEGATQDLAGDGTDGERDSVVADRAGAGGSFEVQLNPDQHLRHHEGGAGSLDDAGEDQPDRIGGEPASQGGNGEQAEAGEKELPIPIQVAEARAGDQQHRVGERVAGNREL